MKYKFLLLTSLLVLAFSSCKNIEQDTSLSETTTVTFASDNTRSIYTKLSDSKYTYTIRGKAKSGATFQTDRHYTYNELSYTRFEIQKGTWNFTMNVFTGEEVISTGTKYVTIDKSSVISIPVYAKTGSTASLSVKLNFPTDKGVAKITAALYDSVTEADAGTALILESGYATYTNDDVPTGTSKILKFYLYDCQDVCIASYIESVYLAAQDNISVERTLSNVNMFAATVCVKDVNGNDVIDSGLLVKAVKVDKEYPMTAVSGTNMYTASLPVGTYDVYSGQTDTGVDLTITFINGGNTSLQLDYQVCSLNNFASMISSLTEDSTIGLSGELTYSDFPVIADAIMNSTYNVNINLSLTTGLTSIPDYAFTACSNLSGITIPDSVTSIGLMAFDNCTSLTTISVDSNNANYSSIDGVLFNKDANALINYPAGKQSAAYTIPDSVTSISDYAFQGCTSLSSVTIPDSVTSIGSYAFHECSSLSSVLIPDSVTSIDQGTFDGCTSLSSVTIPDSVTSIGNEAFYGCTELSSVTIPDSVTSIGSYAFYGCTELSSVTIPDSVTSIGSYAFYECSSLSSVIIPDSVTSIDQGTFDGCTSLSSVTIPDSVTSIGNKAFYGCTELSSVTIPDSVTSIGSYAFDGCTSLSSVTIPDSVTSIGKETFDGCTSLSSVSIGDSVTSIGDYAFRDCTSLSSVTIPDSVNSIGSSAFYGCTSLSSVTIPDSVTSIGSYAFYNCTSLSSVTIPDSVTSIGSSAFYGCKLLSSVTIPDSVTSIGWCAFEGCSKLTSLTFKDPTTWYRSPGGLTDLSAPSTNAGYFKDTYKKCHWYKLDE